MLLKEKYPVVSNPLLTFCFSQTQPQVGGCGPGLLLEASKLVGNILGIIFERDFASILHAKISLHSLSSLL